MVSRIHPKYMFFFHRDERMGSKVFILLTHSLEFTILLLHSETHISSHALNRKLKKLSGRFFLESSNECVNVSIIIGKAFIMRAAVKIFEWLSLCDPPALQANFQKEWVSTLSRFCFSSTESWLSWMKRDLVLNMTFFAHSLYLSSTVSKLHLCWVAAGCSLRIFY